MAKFTDAFDEVAYNKLLADLSTGSVRNLKKLFNIITMMGGEIYKYRGLGGLKAIKHDQSTEAKAKAEAQLQEIEKKAKDINIELHEAATPVYDYDLNSNNLKDVQQDYVSRVGKALGEGLDDAITDVLKNEATAAKVGKITDEVTLDTIFEARAIFGKNGVDTNNRYLLVSPNGLAKLSSIASKNPNLIGDISMKEGTVYRIGGFQVVETSASDGASIEMYAVHRDAIAGAERIGKGSTEIELQREGMGGKTIIIGRKSFGVAVVDPNKLVKILCKA